MTGYTGWTSEVAKQSGNYLAVKLDATTGATISVSMGNRGPVDLSDDKYLVVRLTSSDLSTPLVFSATKNGITETKSYDVSQLVLEEA